MKIPYPLLSDIAQGRCLPFVGAGFSKNASLPSDLTMPDWGELTKLLAQDAGTAPNASPPAVAEKYEQQFGRVQLIEAIREALFYGKARPEKAHRAFVQLPFDTVYTTNFDLLLEDAYTEETRPFRSLVGERQLPFHAGQMASSIVKMHGDLRHEEHIVITQTDYAEFMEKYPVIATHLSAMLITRTPLFLGYSLSDPDFNHIRDVVRSRLGAFERMAYVVQFDVSADEVERALHHRLHIISLDSASGPDRDTVLSTFFSEIQAELDTKAAISLRASRPDVFDSIEPETVQNAVESPERSSIIETTSRLCFVIMPLGNKFDEVYRGLIAPVVRDNGLSVLRADEMAGSGFIMEQIRSAIQQSRLCIADLTGNNPNVLYELGFAQAVGKPIVLVADEASHLPFDLAHQRVILYHDAPRGARKLLQRSLVYALSAGLLEEATRLLGQEQYRSAIAAAAVVLEQKLREFLARRPPKDLGRMSLGQMASTARKRNPLKGDLGGRLAEVVQLRNKAVHDVAERSRDEAEFVLKVVTELLELLPTEEPGGTG